MDNVKTVLLPAILILIACLFIMPHIYGLINFTIGAFGLMLEMTLGAAKLILPALLVGWMIWAFVSLFSNRNKADK